MEDSSLFVPVDLADSAICRERVVEVEHIADVVSSLDRVDWCGESGVVGEECADGVGVRVPVVSANCPKTRTAHVKEKECRARQQGVV